MQLEMMFMDNLHWIYSNLLVFLTEGISAETTSKFNEEFTLTPFHRIHLTETNARTKALHRKIRTIIQSKDNFIETDWLNISPKVLKP